MALFLSSSSLFISFCKASIFWFNSWRFLSRVFVLFSQFSNLIVSSSLSLLICLLSIVSDVTVLLSSLRFKSVLNFSAIICSYNSFNSAHLPSAVSALVFSAVTLLSSVNLLPNKAWFCVSRSSYLRPKSWYVVDKCAKLAEQSRCRFSSLVLSCVSSLMMFSKSSIWSFNLVISLSLLAAWLTSCPRCCLSSKIVCSIFTWSGSSHSVRSTSIISSVNLFSGIHLSPFLLFSSLGKGFIEALLSSLTSICDSGLFSGFIGLGSSLSTSISVLRLFSGFIGLAFEMESSMSLDR